MQYLALLLGPESTSPPDAEAQTAEMGAYQNFHAQGGIGDPGGRRADAICRWRADLRRA